MDLDRVEASFNPHHNNRYAVSRGGMVSSAFPLASQAGALMLENGGNAVDAAAAAAITLCVCEPQACGLGGQTMVLVHLNGRSCFIDGTGRVPALARLEKFGPEDQKFGYKATSIPTTIATLGYMVEKYGNLAWRKIIEPAVTAAGQGYAITDLQHRLQARELANFEKIESRSGARYFLKNGKKPFLPGEIFKQPELADLLEHLADNGPAAFYSPPIADLIDRDMRENNGFLRAADLTRIPWPKERPALVSDYRGLQTITAPPPAAGRNLFSLLRMFEKYPSSFLAENSGKSLWFMAQAIRRVLSDRRCNPIDPDQYDPCADRFCYAKENVQPLFGAASGLGDHGGETTHISAMDGQGNAVALTQSINLVYASKAAARGLGFLYNDYLLDCSVTDPGHPNFLKPGNQPISFVVPLIVMRDNRPWLAVGSPGSERILSTVAQFIVNVVDGSMPICAAMERPRLHYSPEGLLSMEAGRFAPELVNYLEKQAGQVSRRRDYAFYMGAVHATLNCLSKKNSRVLLRFEGMVLLLEIKIKD